MAPAQKRKRGDNRSYSHDGHDGSNRPSPHRPENMGLAQQGRNQGHYSHQHGQGSYSPSYSQQRGGRGGARRYDRGGRNNVGQNQQTNGSSAPMSSNSTAGKNGGNVGRDESSNAHSTKAATPADVVMSPRGSDSQKPSETPAPSQQPSTPAAPQTPAPPIDPPQPRPYHFKNITNERLQTWDDNGRAAVVDAIVQGCNSQDPIAVSKTFQEVLRAGLDGRIDSEDAGKMIADSLAEAPPEEDFSFAELFLDTLSILTDSEPTHPRVKSLVLATDISLKMMREVLEVPLLQTLGLIRPTFDRMFIRKQTNILYKQSNYNLLREETEGYSKLVTELFTTTITEPPTVEVVEDTFENVKALIGAFDLDAGRVLDVTLDVFASLLVKQYRFFVKLLRASSWWPQEQTYGLETESQGFGSLPPWAQPDHSSWLATEEEKEEIIHLKNKRDVLFWERARQVGMDAFFELGGRRLVGDHELEDLINRAIPEQSGDARAEETREWIKSTKTLPPSGNPVAAQLLGFKLRFYASGARDPHDSLPVNLIYLAALLIKIGFISLRDLYPHLFPEDESMTEVKEKMMREKEDREMAKRPGGGTMNALARSGALADDTLPPPTAVGRLREPATRASTPSKSDPTSSAIDTAMSKAEEEDKVQLPEPSDQKVQLLRSLLCIGAIPESLYLLGRFTWLPDAFPDLPDHIHRLLHYSLQKVYEPLRPLRNREGLREAAQTPAPDQTGVPKGEIRLQDTPPIKTLRWAQLDRNDPNEAIDYRFYWDDWSDNVPMCQNVDDVFTLCSTFLNLSGVKIGQDSALLVKLARIGKHSLNEDFSEANQARWSDLCKRLIAPALSLTKSNPGVVNEVHDLLKLFSTPIRYSIYNEWFLGPTSRLPDLEAAFGLARAETKDTLRRMTKTNQRVMARSLAKAACGSPGVVFQVVFSQIESYQNLIDVVVECARYFTYMGYDILTWALLSSLGRAGRSRASNGINVSQWLGALATFTGKVFKRYAIMNPLPILQYVLQQLCTDNFADLQILRELVSSMAGIASDTDFTDSQLQAMAGGELLQGQILQQLLDKRHESKISGKRLMKTIVENDLAGSLLVTIAQQRERCIFNKNLTQIKVMAENFDAAHIGLTQYHDMLRHGLSIKEFDQLIPEIYSLMSEYGIEPAIAFMIHRKGIVKAMEEYDEAKKRNGETANVNGKVLKTEPSQSHGDTGTTRPDDEDVEMTEPTLENGAVQNMATGATQSSVEANGILIEVAQPTGGSKSAEALGSRETAATPSQTSTHQEAPNFEWHPVIQEIMDKIKPVLPAEFENSMSLPFFVTFWQLALNDLSVPTQSYNEEISRQKEQLAAINADRTDVSTTGVQKKDKEKRAINEFLSRLTAEMKYIINKHGLVRSRLDKEKQHYFQGFSGKGKALINGLLQNCFVPRILMSPLDSLYSWRMFLLLHNCGTPGFRTMYIIDRLFNEKVFSNLMFHCTSREAENFGRFLNELLKELTSWHASRTEYEKKAFGPKKTLTGFADKMTRDGRVEKLVDYEEFRNLLHKWHVQLYNALSAAFQNVEYMHIKNACIILRSIILHFPAVNWMGQKLYDTLKEVAKDEEDKGQEGRRDDIYVVTYSALGSLKSRQPHWVMPQAFHLNKNLKTQRTSSRTPSATPVSPLPATSASAPPLNAAAPVFEPQTGTPANGDQNTSASGKADVEDGELEDMVMSEAKPNTEPFQKEASAASQKPNEQSLPTTTPPKPEAKKDEFAEMRARVQASAEAKRRQSQAAADSTKPSLVDRGSTSTAPTTQSGTSNLTQTKEAGSSAPPERRSTPAANLQRANPNIPPRPELTGGNSTSTPDRQPHALPNRPELQNPQRNRYPTRPQEGSPSGMPERPDSQGRPFQDGQRTDRTGDTVQQRYNDRPGQPASRPDKMSGYQRPEASARHMETNHYDERGTRQAPPEFGARSPRDVRPSGRELIDSRPSGRDDRAEPQQRPNPRHDGYGPSHQPPSRGSASVPATPEPDRPINPAGAAIIFKNDGPERPGSHNRQPEPVHSHDTVGRQPRSRPQSPTRSDGRPNDFRRDGRPDSTRAPPYESRPPRDNAIDHAPNGPRNGPPPRHGPATENYGRSDLMQPPSSRAHQDRGSGRFSQEYAPRMSPRHQDDNYGRLKADPVTSQSSQLANRPDERGPRNANEGPLPPARRPSGADSSLGHRSPAVDRAAPATAGDEKHGQRQAAQTSSSAPPTPAAEDSRQDLSGIHPSRLKGFNEGPVRPPPIQTDGAASQQPQQANQAPPSGPRAVQTRVPESPTSATSMPSPAPRNAPAGPANLSDRRNRDGSARRQLAEMQQTLSQSGQPSPSTPSVGPNTRNSSEQGTSIRGRAAAGKQQQPYSNSMQNGHSEIAEIPRDSRQSQMQGQILPGPGSTLPPARDRLDRERPNTRGSSGSARERSPQREPRGRGDANRDYREREDPGVRSHRSSREQSRDTREDPKLREREKDHGRSLRGSDPESQREREYRDPRSARPSGYETRHRGVERDRDGERDRRDQPYPPRGNGGWGAPEQPPGPSSGNSARLVDGRDRREGPGSGPGSEGRKRAWVGDEGGSGKRPRRGGN